MTIADRQNQYDLILLYFIWEGEPPGEPLLNNIHTNAHIGDHEIGFLVEPDRAGIVNQSLQIKSSRS